MTHVTDFLTTCLQAGWAERTGWTLVHSLWQIAAITGVYAFLMLLLRNRSASARYMVGCVAMAAMLALPAVTYVVLPTSAGPKLEVPSDQTPVAATLLPEPSMTPREFTFTEPEVIAVDPPAAAPILAEHEAPTFMASLSSILQHWTPWITAAWLIGVLLLSFRPVWGWLHVRRLRRHGVAPLSDSLQELCGDLATRLGVRRVVEFARSALVEVPTVVGYLKPMILLPASALSGLSTSQIELILAHELAHVRRHDYLVNLVQTVLESLLFYHPGMWWVSSQIRRERENCCDDMALALGGSRANYVRALAQLEERRSVPAAALAASGGSLLLRARRLLGQPQGGFGYRHATAWLAGAMTIGFVAAVLAFGDVAPGESKDLTKETNQAADSSETENEARTRRVPEEHSDRRNAKTAEAQSDLDAMRAYARALGAGDFETLEKTWEFEDDLNRQFARKGIEIYAQAKDMRVDLVSMRRLGEDSLFACFLARNGPDRFANRPVPLLTTFHRKDGRWRCSPPGDLRSMLNVRRLGVERIGRRAVSQSVIAMRLGPMDANAQTARIKAQAEAFARLAGPPYNLSEFKKVAEQMEEHAKEQQALLQNLHTNEDAWRLVIQEGGKEILPKPDDFFLCFYLEADKDEPHARELPFADSDKTFRAEPFPCLTENAVLEAKVVTDAARNMPSVEVTLTEGGAKRFARLTRDSVGKRLAIVIDGKVVSAPLIRAAIPGGRARIDGAFTIEDAERIAEKLNAYREEARKFLEEFDKEERGTKGAKAEAR